MARILVLESDPVSAALLEDRLHVSGHQAMLADDPARAVSSATDDAADLVILAMELPVVSGIEVIRQLKSRGETRSLPIVALSESGESADRLAALRAGADEYLTRPVEVEELLLRVDRLLGHRGAAPAVMQGDLASHPSWELVQYVQQAGKSGELVIRGSRGAGKLQVESGRVTAARFKEVRGRDALLAILDTKEGHFRLTTEDAAGGPPSAESFAIQEVLMEAAWIEDQLARRREHLPATGAPLRPARQKPPPAVEELASLPIDKVFGYLSKNPGARIYDLIHRLAEAPSKVRLAVAWLVEQGAVAPDRPDQGEVMSTVEISSSMVLDLAVHNLLSSARDAGLDITNLSYLLLAEPGVQPQLVELVETEPGFRSNPTLSRLVEQLKLRRGGSADFVTDFGSLCLHVQILTPEIKAQIEAIVPVCAGVMMWLDQGAEIDLIDGVIRRLDAVGGSVAGVIVSQSSATLKILAELTAGVQPWKTVRHAPRSLIGVLRLLHPRSKA